MLHDPAPDKWPSEALGSTRARSLERRNPASQTIILSQSQCSSRAWPVASPADLPIAHFPVKSGHSAALATPERLTVGAPDVGTGEVLHSNLIRLLAKPPVPAQGASVAAFKAPSCWVSVPVGPTPPGNTKGIDPDGACET